MEYDSKTVGLRIRQARKDAGWSSQDKLIEQLRSRQAGISRTTLSAIEAVPDNSKPDDSKEVIRKKEKQEAKQREAVGHLSISTLCAMCDLFDCDMGYLLGEYEEKHRVAAEVCDATGLSETAVQRLSAELAYSKQLSPTQREESVQPIEILSSLLSDGEFWRVLNNLSMCTTTVSEQLMNTYDAWNADFRNAKAPDSERVPFADAMRDSQIASAAMHFSTAAARAVGWSTGNKNAATAEEPKRQKKEDDSITVETMDRLDKLHAERQQSSTS